MLGAETDCQADDPGTGQEWRDVDAQVGHGGDRTDHHQDDFDRVAQQRQDGFDAGTGLRRAFVDRRFQRFLDRRIEHHPEQPGDQKDQTDTAQ
ncbi:hypothetical protein D3C84_858060 [compost metagenome]